MQSALDGCVYTVVYLSKSQLTAPYQHKVWQITVARSQGQAPTEIECEIKHLSDILKQ